MANVHRIGDYNDNEAQNRQQQMRMGGMFGAGGQDGENPMNEEDARNNPLIRALSRQNGEDPRRETFWTMLKTYFCPTFTWKTCIFVFALLNLILFIVSLAKTKHLNNAYFLGIGFEALCDLGAKDAELLQQGQVHRFVMPIILHTGFLHIVQNTVFLLIIGSFFEVLVQPLRFFVIYIVAGIGGNLLSALASDNLAAGASTSLTGIVGGIIAFIVVNWIAMESYKQIRCCLLCMVIMIVFLTVLYALADITASSDSNIDHYGHLGGFITGLPLSMALMPVLATSMNRHRMPGFTYEKICKYVGAVAVSLWLIIGMAMFYTQRNPISICSRVNNLIQ